MAASFFQKLTGDLWGDHGGVFLKAATAVCALAAAADKDIDPAERYRFGDLLKTDPALKGCDAEKAMRNFDASVTALEAGNAGARRDLDKAVRQIAGDDEKARLLLSYAYMVIAADQMVREAEELEFRRLCGLLAQDPERQWNAMAIRFLVWDESSEIAFVKVPTMQVSRIVNENIYRKWRVFDDLEEAKTAIGAIVRQALEIRSLHGYSEGELEEFLEHLPEITAEEVPNYHDIYT